MSFQPSILSRSNRLISPSSLRPIFVPHSTFTRALSTQPKPPPLKTAIITGASGGIGSAIARRFAKEGHSCILVGRNTSRLDTLLRGLDTTRHACATSPRQHRVEIGDVGTEEFWSGLSKNLVFTFPKAGTTDWVKWNAELMLVEIS